MKTKLEERLKQAWKVKTLYKIKKEAEQQQLVIRHIESDSPLVNIDSRNEPDICLQFKDGTTLTMSVRDAKNELYIGTN